MTLLRFGAVTHEICPGVSITAGAHWRCYSLHAEKAGQRATAIQLGYGDDVERLNRDHDLAHCMLAHVIGLPHSPTLRAIASGVVDPVWSIEEDAVKSMQRFARAMCVDLVEAAKRADR